MTNQHSVDDITKELPIETRSLSTFISILKTICNKSLMNFNNLFHRLHITLMLQLLILTRYLDFSNMTFPFVPYKEFS